MEDDVAYLTESRADVSRGEAEEAAPSGAESLKEKIGHAFHKIKENAREERELDDMVNEQVIGEDQIPDEFGGPVM